MTQDADTKDLVLLVADKNMEAAVQGLLNRSKSLGIRKISADVFRHPNHDPGCLLEAHDFLRPFARQYDRALVLFDRDGCGSDKSRQQLEQEVEARLQQSSWAERAAVVVLDPELENWVWSDSPHVERELGWKETTPRLREWLVEQGLLKPDEDKPSTPKEALELVLRRAGIPRSSALYKNLAEKIGLGRCTDPAFGKFRATLSGWFPSE